MNKDNLQFSLQIFLLFISIFLFNYCSATNPINDFFGIKMYPAEEKSFKIISYTPEKGVSYTSNRNMNTNIFAWAKINVNTIIIKIINNSKEAIPLNYNIDEYVIVTNEDNYYLEKGDRKNYFDKSQIEPNSSFEITLELPADYWKTMGTSVNYTSQAKLTKDILKEYSKTGTKLNVKKENIKYILVNLAHNITIVLKHVPKK